MKLKAKLSKVAVAVVSGLVASAAMAADPGTGPDLTPLTSQVNFGTVITAVMAVSGSLVLLYLAIKGSKTVLSFIRGG